MPTSEPRALAADVPRDKRRDTSGTDDPGFVPPARSGRDKPLRSENLEDQHVTSGEPFFPAVPPPGGRDSGTKRRGRDARRDDRGTPTSMGVPVGRPLDPAMSDAAGALPWGAAAGPRGRVARAASEHQAGAERRADPRRKAQGCEVI